jgi:DNA invertase Pin-like site-specific DNA recombinase
MAEKAREGVWPSRAPLGYRNVVSPSGEKRIEPDPDVAPLVQQLFTWYSTGRYSLGLVTMMARNAGLRYRRSGAFLPKTTIHRLLRNPIYCGDIR